MSAPAADAVSDAVLMTLAGMAYGAPDRIAGYVIGAAAPTTGWTVIWLAAPPDPPDNFAYLARHAASGACVLAIRGTYPDPLSAAYWNDATEDSPFGPMTDWSGATGARIGGGTATGLVKLMALTDAKGTTLTQAIAAMPAGTNLTVTGHSLGGTLAPVVALQLATQPPPFPQLRVTAVSFAGMTPGDAGFAALFNGGAAGAGPLATPVRRVFNTQDTVAYGWDRVLATANFYQPAPEGGWVVKAMLAYTAAKLEAGGYDYTAIGQPVPLKGVVRPPSLTCALIAYTLEMLHQHMPDTYLTLLGAPPLPFTIGFGTIVTDAALPAVELSARLPVAFIDTAR